jgi:catechol 2,3-dioxygenase-like lactoylglutathione lyase family enzyme
VITLDFAMAIALSAVTYLVKDYDEAIHWFTHRLGFLLLEDTDLGSGKRWVRVAPSQSGTSFVLAMASDASQQQAITNAAGGRVAYFLYTDDFPETHARMIASGMYFREQPRHEAYGTVAVFNDLYGNGWDLIGPAHCKID